MVTLQSTKTCGIALAMTLAACGGGGGDPGVSPHANNDADTKLHPETHVERWWPGCSEGNPCTQSGMR